MKAITWLASFTVGVAALSASVFASTPEGWSTDLEKAFEKAKAEMKPGAWLVSLEFEAADLKANATTEASPGRPVWLYQAPFNASA